MHRIAHQRNSRWLPLPWSRRGRERRGNGVVNIGMLHEPPQYGMELVSTLEGEAVQGLCVEPQEIGRQCFFRKQERPHHVVGAHGRLLIRHKAGKDIVRRFVEAH
jgi:hypothetical protein